MNNLVLFTLNFPFGKGEAFLEPELPILSEVFDQVFILPSQKVKGIRKLPKNVTVVDIFSDRDKRINRLNIYKYFNNLLKIFIYSFIHSKRRFYYLKYWKSLVGFAIDDLSKKELLQKFIIENKLFNAIYYDYWFVNSTISIANLKKSNHLKFAVARCHRFDLYDEELFEKVVPFREYKLRHLNYLNPISDHGKKYLLSEVSKKYHNKIKLYYLGINFVTSEDKSRSNSNVIVSCSRVVEHKKVLQIVDILKEINLDIKWIHFGDGPLMRNLIEKCQELPSNIKFELNGETDNEKVLEFYSQFQIDLFVSLSESEGLPVSIMEAMMFGIPIYAKEVFGIPEIVDKYSGILIPENSNDLYIRDNLIKGLKTNFDSTYISNRIKERFNSNINHTKYSQFLIDEFKKLDDKV